jgi:hypothetical protein
MVERAMVIEAGSRVPVMRDATTSPILQDQVSSGLTAQTPAISYVVKTGLPTLT